MKQKRVQNGNNENVAKKGPLWPFCGFFWENVDKNGAFVNI